MLGGSPRALYEVQYNQNVQSIQDMLAIGFLTEAQAADLLAMVDGLLEEARHMPHMTGEELADALIFGLPALYQLSIAESLPQTFMARNNAPVLIIHGDRDFQILTEQDFNVLVRHTQDMPHVTAIMYDDLNHLFMRALRQEGERVVDIMEYRVPGTVDRQLLQDVLDWLNALG
jgi:pimeloyl-ACP methyl ester carboxylesterase